MPLFGFDLRTLNKVVESVDVKGLSENCHEKHFKKKKTDDTPVCSLQLLLERGQLEGGRHQRQTGDVAGSLPVWSRVPCINAKTWSFPLCIVISSSLYNYYEPPCYVFVSSRHELNPAGKLSLNAHIHTIQRERERKIPLPHHTHIHGLEAFVGVQTF